MPKVDGYNANFSSFVNFAEQSVAAGAHKAVANVGDTLAGRKISVCASKTDAAYSALSRSKADKTLNDQTRTLFRAAIAEMFGGEGHIPESVRSQMKIGDYGKGRPLTARRIMKVKEAIDAELAIRAFDETVERFGKDLSPDEVKTARRIFDKNSAGMPPTNAKMYARYLFALDLAGDGEDMDEVESKAERMADELRAWRDFDFNDADVAVPRAVFTKEVTAYAKELASQNDLAVKAGYPNVTTQMYKDCDRSIIIINGTRVPAKLSKAEVLDIFTKAVPGAKAQQIISSAMNQSLASSFMYTSERQLMPMHDGSDPVDVGNLPGGKMLVGRNREASGHLSALSSSTCITYSLDVSDDGKTVTLVNTLDNKLMVSDRFYTADTTFGSAKQSIKLVFDLSDQENPVIKSVDIAQKLSVDDPKKA